MTRQINVWDRLRIERLVWALDQRLYDLPSKTRVATRRDVRANLLTAATDVGAREALRGMGSSQQLAARYLDAEYGEGPRHSWIAAAFFLTGLPFLLNWALEEVMSAYARGATAADPHLTGTLSWQGISHIQSGITYVFADGAVTRTGGAWTPLVYAFLVVGTVLAGRLWRLVPTRRRRVAAPDLETAAR